MWWWFDINGSELQNLRSSNPNSVSNVQKINIRFEHVSCLSSVRNKPENYVFDHWPTSDLLKLVELTSYSFRIL